MADETLSPFEIEFLNVAEGFPESVSDLAFINTNRRSSVGGIVNLSNEGDSSACA